MAAQAVFFGYALHRVPCVNPYQEWVFPTGRLTFSLRVAQGFLIPYIVFDAEQSPTHEKYKPPAVCRVDLTLYYCRKDNRGTCHIKDLQWRPEVRTDGPETKRARLAYAVPPP